MNKPAISQVDFEDILNPDKIIKGAEVTMPKINIDTSAFDSILVNSHESKLNDFANFGNTQAENEVKI